MPSQDEKTQQVNDEKSNDYFNASVKHKLEKENISTTKCLYVFLYFSLLALTIGDFLPEIRTPAQQLNMFPVGKV